VNVAPASRWLPDPVERANLVLSAGAVAASVAFAPPRFAASLAVGVLLEIINFRALRRAARRFFAQELAGPVAWLGLFGLRFGLLGVAMYLALDAGANPAGLVLGLSLVVPAAIWVAWRSRPAVLPASAFDVPPPDDPSWDDWNPWLAREREPDEDREETR
jgi:hypothetical protein